MHTSTVFNSMHEKIAAFYKSANEYLAEKNKIGSEIKRHVDISNTAKFKSDAAIFRKSSEYDYLKDRKYRNEKKFNNARSEFIQKFSNDCNDLAESILSNQPAFDVSNDKLQDSLRIAKLGKNLPFDVLEHLLSQYITDKTSFEVIKSALLSAGVSKDGLPKIYPYNANDLAEDFTVRGKEIAEEYGDSFLYKLSKLEKDVRKAAHDYGTDLTSFIDDESAQKINNDYTRAAMGLSSEADKAFQVFSE